MATMTARLACCLLLLVFFATGCAATPKGYTERDLQAREGLCEYQSPGMI